MSLKTIRAFLWVGIITVLGLIILDQANKTPIIRVDGNAPTAQEVGQALIGGPFELVNQRGEAVKESDFRGKWMLVYFGFTNCPAICPTDVNNISMALQAMDDDARANVAPIFITIDPARDTPEQISAFLSNMHPDIVGLTGTQAQVDVAKGAYRVFAKKVEMDGMAGMEGMGYMMDHSTFTYIMNPQGEYVTHLAHNTAPDAIVARLKAVMVR